MWTSGAWLDSGGGQDSRHEHLCRTGAGQGSSRRDARICSGTQGQEHGARVWPAWGLNAALTAALTAAQAQVWPRSGTDQAGACQIRHRSGTGQNRHRSDQCRHRSGAGLVQIRRSQAWAQGHRAGISLESVRFLRADVSGCPDKTRGSHDSCDERGVFVRGVKGQGTGRKSPLRKTLAQGAGEGLMPGRKGDARGPVWE